MFGKSKPPPKKALTNIFLKRLGIESMMAVYQTLVKEGHKNKLKYIPDLIKELYPPVFVLTASNRTKWEGLITINKNKKVESIIDQEHDGAKTFLKALKKVATIKDQKETELLEIAKKVQLRPGLLSRNVVNKLYIETSGEIKKIQNQIKKII